MSLSDRMKAYEFDQDSTLKNNPHETYCVIRLDGKGFSKYTKKYFINPFDTCLRQLLIDCALQLLEEIDNAKFIYTQSDEISIIIPPLPPKANFWFGGRAQKIVSVAASLLTKSFNKLHQTDDEFIGNATFDARVFQLPTEIELVNYLRFRQKDSFRNYINKIAQHKFGKKQILNIRAKELATKLYGENYEDNPNFQPIFAYGTFLNKEIEIVEKIIDIEFEKALSIVRPLYVNAAANQL